ncbi:cohesin domain-containing protein, partial [Patescibacteria group bacterium]
MKTKKILLIVLAVLLICSLPVAVFLVRQRVELRIKAEPASTIEFVPSTRTVSVGEEFSLEAVIKTDTNAVPVVELYINFNPSIFEAITLAMGADFSGIIEGPDIDNGLGTAHFVVEQISEPVQGTGTVAIITFRALAATSTPEEISFASDTQAGAWEEGGVNVLVGMDNASITVSSGTAPTSTPTATPTQPGTA